MPFYEYMCEKCDHKETYLFSYDERPAATACPQCHTDGSMVYVISSKVSGVVRGSINPCPRKKDG